MTNYEQLKADIAAVVRANGIEAITGDRLQQVLTHMVDVLGNDYALAGVATPTTNPPTPDGNTAYIAGTSGTYTYFLDGNYNPLVVPSNCLTALLMYDASAEAWTAYPFGTIAQGTIGTNELADGAVTTPKIANSAVTTPKINEGAVSEQKLATALQNKINDAVTLSTAQTITGDKEFTQPIVASELYGDGDLSVHASDDLTLQSHNGQIDITADDDMNINAHHLDINNPTGIDGDLSVIGDINATGDVHASGDIKAVGKVYANINDELATKDYTDTQLATKQDTIADLSTIRAGAAAGATAYQKPSGGIPESDLSASVQTSLGKADTALQDIPDGSVTTPKIADEAVTLPKIATSAIDATPTANSGNLVTSGGVADALVYTALNIEDDMQKILKCSISDTGTINLNDGAFYTYVLYNDGYKNIKANLAYFSAGSAAISFWSGQTIATANFISAVSSIGDRTFHLYEADVPSNCVIIAICVSTSFVSDFYVKLVDGMRYAEKKMDDIYNVLKDNEVTLSKRHVNNGYLANNSAVDVLLSSFNDGQSVFTKTTYSVNEGDLLVFDNPNSYTIGFWWYKADGTYLSRDWFTSVSQKVVPANAAFVRFAMRKAGLNMANFGTFSAKKAPANYMPIEEQDDIILPIKTFTNGYINTSDVIASDANSVCTPLYIKVVSGGYYRIVSPDVAMQTAHWYDINKSFVGYDGWNNTDLTFRVPNNVAFIRITLKNTGLQVGTMTSNVWLVREYATGIDGDYYVGGMKTKYTPAHLFINESVAGTGIVIPSQSLADVEVSAKLGFSHIEFNVHKTSDDVLVVMHGASGTFGKQVEHVDGVTDIKDVAFNSVTYAWIQANVRYKSSHAVYRTTIPTLEEALRLCKYLDIRPSVGLNTGDDIADKEAVTLAQKYFGNNFMVGTYGDAQSQKVRRYFKGMIFNWSGTIDIATIQNNCNIIGTPYCQVLSTTALLNLPNVADRIAVAKAVHELGCLCGFAQSYVTESEGQSLFACGFDTGSSGWNVPIFSRGNVGNYFDAKTFSQFTHGGSVSGGVLTLSVGETIGKALNDAVFAAGGCVKIWFNGEITLNLGRYINGVSLQSDGTQPMFISSLFLDETPALLVTATASTTISELSFLVNQVQ